MKTKIRALSMILAIIMVLSLSACGDPGTNSSTPAPNTDESSSSTAETTTPSSGTGPSVVLRVGIGATADSSLGKGLTYMGQLLEEYSKGDMTLELYPDNLLGGDRDMVEAVSMGTIEMCNVATGTISNFCEELFTLDMPFLITDLERAYAVFDGEQGRELLDNLHRSNIEGLGFWEVGTRVLYSREVPIVHPEDVAALKFRVMESDVHQTLWNGLGAYATPMSIGEVFTALQQGVIDGHDNPINVTYTQKMYEVEPYCTLTNHIYCASINIINKDLYDSLTDEQREILNRADAEARAYERTLVAEDDEAAKEGWLASGGTIYEVDAQEWVEATAFAYETFADKIDMDLVNAFRGK